MLRGFLTSYNGQVARKSFHSKQGHEDVATGPELHLRLFVGSCGDGAYSIQNRYTINFDDSFRI